MFVMYVGLYVHLHVVTFSLLLTTLFQRIITFIIYLCMHESVNVCTMACVGGERPTCWDWVSQYTILGPWDQTQVVRLGSNTFICSALFSSYFWDWFLTETEPHPLNNTLGHKTPGIFLSFLPSNKLIEIRCHIHYCYIVETLLG